MRRNQERSLTDREVHLTQRYARSHHHAVPTVQSTRHTSHITHQTYRQHIDVQDALGGRDEGKVDRVGLGSSTQHVHVTQVIMA